MMETATRRSDLTPGERRLVREMQRLRFGRIENLPVRRGEPVFEPGLTRSLRKIKLRAANRPHPAMAAGDTQLKSEVVELLEHLRGIGDGLVRSLTVIDGLPFDLDVEEEPSEILKIIRESGLNIPNEDLIIDPGIAPIGADMDGITKRVLDSIARLKADPEFSGCHFSVGLSNFTVMLPPKRANGKAVKTPLQNAFLTRAIPLGLDMIIGAADREYRILKPGDDALVCLDEFLALEDVEATIRVKEFYS